MSVVIVLSGRGLCIGLNTRPTECDRAASIMRRPWPRSGCYAMTKKKILTGLLPRKLRNTDSISDRGKKLGVLQHVLTSSRTNSATYSVGAA